MERTFTVELDGNRTADLRAEEWVSYEPSAYHFDEGWICFDLNTDTEYFISSSGNVWRMPENKLVGVCPEVAARWTE